MPKWYSGEQMKSIVVFVTTQVGLGWQLLELGEGIGTGHLDWRTGIPVLAFNQVRHSLLWQSEGVE